MNVMKYEIKQWISSIIEKIETPTAVPWTSGRQHPTRSIWNIFHYNTQIHPHNPTNNNTRPYLPYRILHNIFSWRNTSSKGSTQTLPMSGWWMTVSMAGRPHQELEILSAKVSWSSAIGRFRPRGTTPAFLTGQRHHTGLAAIGPRLPTRASMKVQRIYFYLHSHCLHDHYLTKTTISYYTIIFIATNGYKELSR